MSKERQLGQPYKALGEKLKAARVSLKRSVGEASGAIEIDEDTFKRIELGEQRPAEDTLMVLISYLEIKDDEATQLWDLAGYSDSKNASSNVFELNQPITMVMPVDLRVVYTDMVHVMVNNFGVVMNFMQGAGQNGQPLAVARIGMSQEHAKSVLDILDKSLKQSNQHNQPKLLRQSKKSSQQIDNKKEDS